MGMNLQMILPFIPIFLFCGMCARILRAAGRKPAAMRMVLRITLRRKSSPGI